MATKTIPELEQLTVGDSETILPVDDGTQTYKMAIDDLLKSAQTVLAVTSVTRDALTPSAGWEIFNTDQVCKQVYTGTVWVNVGPQTGDLVASGRASAAPGYLACDGASYLRSAYPDLFAAISNSFGAADGTHFNVPDTRRKVLMGSGGTGTGIVGNALGNSGGAETHTLTSSESGMPAHAHTASQSGHTHAGKVGGNGADNAQNSGAWGTNNNGSYGFTQSMTTVTPSITVDSASALGASSSHNNIQPSLVVANYIKI